MNTLSLKTTAQEDGTFLTQWKWRYGQARQPIVGSMSVVVDASHAEDRSALAELRAIYYLLEEREIQGENRLGNNLTIEVSTGAIRKALLKGALKTTGIGKTQKEHVASAAGFLATKFFESVIEVGRWKDEEPKSVEPMVHLAQGPVFMQPRLPCLLLGADVGVTRHAMHRYIARIDQKRDKFTEDDLSDVADSRWSAAWKWFARVLGGENLKKATLLPKVSQHFLRKFGSQCEYLHFPDSETFIVVRKEGSALNIVSVMRITPFNPIVKMDVYMMGQKLVSGHKRMVRKLTSDMGKGVPDGN